jgi:hypothetical protein
MEAIVLQQALLTLRTREDVRWAGQSADLPEAVRAAIEQLAKDFGATPAAVTEEVFWAQPLQKEWIALGRAIGLGGDQQHPPEVLAMHFLVLRASDYLAAAGDPFAIAAACPVAWEQRGTLATVTYPVPPGPRTVQQVRSVIRSPDGLMLLGAVQDLVDGGRVAFVRSKPDTALLRALWTLLPIRARCAMWPATFVYNNAPTFHASIASAEVARTLPPYYLSEEQAANYPEGAYEHAVHAAAETDDQEYLDVLFARRSAAEVWRLGWWLVGGLIVLSFAMSAVKGCGG